MRKINYQSPPTPKPPRPLRRAFAFLDHSLDQNAPADNSDLIELFGRHHFGDLWKPRQSQNQPN